MRDALLHAQAERWPEARERARAAGGDVGERIIRWIYLKRRGGSASFGEIASFIEAAPDWPEMGRMLRDAEQVMPDSLPDESVLRWFQAHPPVTGAGRMQLVQALFALGKDQEATRVLRLTWSTDSLDPSQERVVLARYRHLLDQDDHRARVDSLLWRRQTAAAQRNLQHVDTEFRAVAEARMRLTAGQDGVDAALARVAPALSTLPGLVFDRAVWQRKKGRNDDARQLLLSIPRDPANAERWWAERHVQSRLSLREGDVSLAYELAARHGQAPDDGLSFTEAEWTAGWIALRFLGNPVQAYRHF
ncbi:MAG: lytic transglycosylase domain-containing protein, partial [Alphaproteobacteria bacterium]|nr:lytic transglycosylase domain-containing protein [Alphaproteobacteria bacterium]